VMLGTHVGIRNGLLSLDLVPEVTWAQVFINTFWLVDIIFLISDDFIQVSS